MKTIYNIKLKDEFYIIRNENIVRFMYMGILPSKNPEYETPKNYHIVINKDTERPERWYYTDLEGALDKEWAYDYDDSKKFLLEKIKNKYEDILNKFNKYY